MNNVTNNLILQYKSGEIMDRRRGASGVTVNARDTKPLAIVPEPEPGKHPWDQSHELLRKDKELIFVEPEVNTLAENFANYWEAEVLNTGAKENISHYTFLKDWPHPEKPSGWYLEDGFSQLKPARDEVKKLALKHKVRIAHLDTGYDPGHISFPAQVVNLQLQRNFVEGEEAGDARDTFSTGPVKAPGHGVGTLSILAGGKVKIDECGFDDYLGLHDLVEIVPIRIAKSVVLFKSAAFVKAMDYIVNELNAKDETRVHIISMSMGGVASKTWADMVNLAYKKGIFMVTAAGNNFGRLTPRRVVYPARFERVVAACGVTYDYSPYVKPLLEGGPLVMQGNYGPSHLMENAIAAFTPNVFWAKYNHPQVVGIQGNGTSAATPQIAAAAALYYIKHYEALEALQEPWMRVEAIKKALFSKAGKRIAGAYGKDDWKKYFGNGVLQAKDMLTYPVAKPDDLEIAREAEVKFPLLKVLTGWRKRAEPGQEEDKMYATELSQLLMSDTILQEILNDEETEVTDMSKEQKRKFIERVLDMPQASDALKEQLRNVNQF